MKKRAKKVKEQPETPKTVIETITASEVVDKANENQLFAELLEITQRKSDVPSCEFLSCKKNAEVFIEGFHLCPTHALSLIHSFTKKSQ